MSVAIAPEVASALAAGRAVVALETTLISHGMPRPDNARLAVDLEATVRDAGAVPATVAAIDGEVKVGLTRGELIRMATADAIKCSTRDLPLALARRSLGATTVAATIFAADRAGIRLMATGGLGGVHRGGELSMDVSADLEQLARRRVVVVCSGAKSLLDLGRTLERLESLGVPVIGFGCDQFPGFYTAETGLSVPGVDDLPGLCDVIGAHFALGSPTALVVAQPPPVPLERREVEELVETALRAAEAAGVHGPAQTPFLLREMARASAGRTTSINRRLVIANADLAGRLSVSLASRAG